jgi:primase-like protein/TOTE conflict system primase-like protein
MPLINTTPQDPEKSSPELECRKGVLGYILDHVRTDAYARCVQQPTYDSKGNTSFKKDYYPVRLNGPKSPLVPIEPEVLGYHLASDGNTYRLGVYPVSPGKDTTQIAVVDVDDHDGKLGWDEIVHRAAKIKAELEKKGLKPYPAKSGGGGGIHLWLLYDRPVPVARNYVLLKRCVEAAGYPIAAGVVDLLPGENPVDDGRFGKCVSLPFSNQQPAWDVEQNCERPAGSIEVCSPIALPEVAIPEKNQRGAPPQWDADKIRSALQWIDSDDYNDWYRILQALNRSGDGSDEAMEIAREWSARSAKYTDKGFDDVWPKLKPDMPASGGVTLGTLYYMAKQAGWNYNEARARTVVGGTGNTIVNVPHELSRVVKELNQKMAALTPPPVTGYAGMLAKVVTASDSPIEDLDEKLYPKSMSRILLFSGRAAALRLMVNEHIEFLSNVPDKGGGFTLRPLAPPADVIASWLQSGDYPGLPKLSRLVYSPVLRSDGSLVSEMGYDPRTGVYRVGDAEGWDDIEPATTIAELSRCLETLLEPIVDFQFDQSYARTGVALAILTGITRHIYGPAPGFLASATGSDSGKTLLTKVVLGCTGGFFGVGPASMPKNNPDELRKYLVALARSGMPYMWLDNIKGGLDSDALEAWHTSGAISARILGVSEDFNGDWRAMALYTVQDDTISVDMLRRTISVRINPGVENPGARPYSDFRHPNLERWLSEGQWKKINMAALRLLRGYMASVPPAKRKQLSGTWVEWGSWTENPMNWAIDMVAGAGLGKVMRQDGLMAEPRPVLAWGFDHWDACTALSQQLGRSDAVVTQGNVFAELIAWLRAPTDGTYYGGSKPVMSFTSSDLKIMLTSVKNQSRYPNLVGMLCDRGEVADTKKITASLKALHETVRGDMTIRFEPGSSKNVAGKFTMHVKKDGRWVTVGMDVYEGRP